MKTFAIAGLCAGLAAAPLVARAADIVVFDAAGHPVGVLVPVAQPVMMPGFPGMPIGFPVAGVFAQQQALIQRMMADMQQLPTMTVPAVQPGAFAPGATVMVSSFSGGGHSCSRTVTYQARVGAAPLVQVSQTGDACAAMPAPGAQATTPVAEPAPQAVTPRPVTPTVPGGTRLYQIDYRHPVAAPKLPRG